MKFCPKCGKTLIEDSVFCMHCGERIDILTESDSKKKDMAKGSRKKLIIACAMIGVIIVFAVLATTLQIGSSKKLSPATNFSFSDYSGIQAIEVLGTQSFPDAEGEIIQETFSGNTEWSIVNAYCQDLENYGFYKEDLSYKFGDGAVWYKFTKTEENETGIRCSYTIFVESIPILQGDNIEIQIQINSLD